MFGNDLLSIVFGSSWVAHVGEQDHPMTSIMSGEKEGFQSIPPARNWVRYDRVEPYSEIGSGNCNVGLPDIVDFVINYAWNILIMHLVGQ